MVNGAIGMAFFTAIKLFLMIGMKNLNLPTDAQEGDLRRRRTQRDSPEGDFKPPERPRKFKNRYNVSEFVFHVQDGVPKRSTNNLTLPFWQHSPVLDGLPYINYDVLEIEANQGPIMEVLNKQQAALGLIH